MPAPNPPAPYRPLTAQERLRRVLILLAIMAFASGVTGMVGWWAVERAGYLNSAPRSVRTAEAWRPQIARHSEGTAFYIAGIVRDPVQPPYPAFLVFAVRKWGDDIRAVPQVDVKPGESAAMQVEFSPTGAKFRYARTWGGSTQETFSFRGQEIDLAKGRIFLLDMTGQEPVLEQLAGDPVVMAPNLTGKDFVTSDDLRRAAALLRTQMPKINEFLGRADRAAADAAARPASGS